jgi:hypothetical protein
MKLENEEYRLEYLVPAENAIGGRPYWTHVDTLEGRLWTASMDEVERVKRDLATAVVNHRPNSIRLIKVTTHVVTVEDL